MAYLKVPALSIVIYTLGYSVKASGVENGVAGELNLPSCELEGMQPPYLANIFKLRDYVSNTMSLGNAKNLEVF